ncbi:Nudix hydrolase 2 [Chlorella vulgaris]
MARNGLVEQAPVIGGHEDQYNGFICDETTLPSSPSSFKAALTTALASWRQRGYRGIWLKVPADKAHVIGQAVDAGFEFHHAEQAYVMLTLWLPDTENKLPPNASHQVGVGAVVMNQQREILVVQEASGPLRGKGVWKMPTGLVQQGEDISEAAEREVLEETGIRARFDAVLAMRQAHGFAFGKSDMFFVVALKLLPGPQARALKFLPCCRLSPMQELVMQEDELVGVRWMPLQEYLDVPFMASRPLFQQIHSTILQYVDGDYRGLQGRKLETGLSARQDLLLFGEAADRKRADRKATEDAWIGLNAAAATDEAAATTTATIEAATRPAD